MNPSEKSSALLGQSWQAQKPANKKFIADLKKKSGANLVQQKLASAASLHNEWAVKEGLSIQDAQAWRALCEKVKFVKDDEAALELLQLVEGTIAMALHCQSTPVHLIHYARVGFGRTLWNAHTLKFMRDHMLDDADGEAEEGEVAVVLDDDEGSYEETSPTSAEAYEIDDDLPSEEGTSKKRKTEED